MNTKLIADALRALADALEAPDTVVPAPAEKPAKAEKAETKAKAKPEPKPEPEPDEEPKEASQEDLIQALQKVAKACGRAKIDEILGEFNVQKAGQLDPADRADVILLAQAAVLAAKEE